LFSFRVTASYTSLEISCPHKAFIPCYTSTQESTIITLFNTSDFTDQLRYGTSTV